VLNEGPEKLLDKRAVSGLYPVFAGYWLPSGGWRGALSLRRLRQGAPSLAARELPSNRSISESPIQKTLRLRGDFTGFRREARYWRR
jgi:hypothetical protein